MKSSIGPGGSWSRQFKTLFCIAFAIVVVALIVSLVLPRPGRTSLPAPALPLPTKAEVEAELPEMWFRGISWELMLSRIDERFPETEPRPEFRQGAKFMVITVKEGDYFVAPDHELLPWPPA